MLADLKANILGRSQRAAMSKAVPPIRGAESDDDTSVRTGVRRMHTRAEASKLPTRESTKESDPFHDRTGEERAQEDDPFK